MPDKWQSRAVSLARYAQLLNLDECAFFGVRKDDQPDYACGTIWGAYQRAEVDRALAQAEQMIEGIVGYPLSPTWIVGHEAQAIDRDDRWVDAQPWTRPLVTRWGHVIAAGVRAETIIQADAAVSLASDPATIGPLATTATVASEIKVFYPDSEREITPKTVTIAGGNVTIQIPKCRLVDAEKLDNPDLGWDYTDSATYQQTVDVKRVYTDPATHATLISPHKDSGNGTYKPASEWTQSAAIWIQNGRIGIVDVLPATYNVDEGEWQRVTNWRCYGYPVARLNYLAGVQTLSTHQEWTIVRLAHSLIPEQPCGCDVTVRYWKRDRNVPQILTAERLNNPFGVSDGAHAAYQFAQSMRLVRAGVI